jgi:hypothetical protein
LSTDETPERISPEQNAGVALSSEGQIRMPFPHTLVLKRERLYEVKNGRLVTKRQRGFWTKKKFVPWYFRDDNS